MTTLALLRGLHLAGILSMLGSTAFIAWTLLAATDKRPALPALIRLWRISGWLALALGAAWFVAQSAQISGAQNFDDLSGALPLVASRTWFGQVLDVRAV